MSNFSSIVHGFFCHGFMVTHTPAKPIVQLHHIPHCHSNDLRPLSSPGHGPSPLHFLLLFASLGNFLFMSAPFPVPFNSPYQGPPFMAWPALLWIVANALKQWSVSVCGGAGPAIKHLVRTDYNLCVTLCTVGTFLHPICVCLHSHISWSMGSVSSQ